MGTNEDMQVSIEGVSYKNKIVRSRESPSPSINASLLGPIASSFHPSPHPSPSPTLSSTHLPCTLFPRPPSAGVSLASHSPWLLSLLPNSSELPSPARNLESSWICSCPSCHQTPSVPPSSSWVPHTGSPTGLAWAPPSPVASHPGPRVPPGSLPPCPFRSSQGPGRPLTAHVMASALASRATSLSVPGQAPGFGAAPAAPSPPRDSLPRLGISHRILPVPLTGRDAPSFQPWHQL